jgi:hypothetical protein
MYNPIRNLISYVVRTSVRLLSNIRIYTEPYTKPYEIYAICNSIYIYTICEHYLSKLITNCPIYISIGYKKPYIQDTNQYKNNDDPIVNKEFSKTYIYVKRGCVITEPFLNNKLNYDLCIISFDTDENDRNNMVLLNPNTGFPENSPELGCNVMCASVVMNNDDKTPYMIDLSGDDNFSIAGNIINSNLIRYMLHKDHDIDTSHMNDEEFTYVLNIVFDNNEHDIPIMHKLQSDESIIILESGFGYCNK